MASDNEATCESDPNFAVICAFMEKFGVTCGLTSIDFLALQEMLENTQEVAQELVDLHIKLFRKSRKTVSNERWEKAVIKFCHTFSVQDAWEIERFGYKKARLSSKLRVLKELLEMQFDYNVKFKSEINKMSAEELRSQPLGKDKHGHAYWFQNDNNCQIRVYKEDPDEETWTLVVKDRDGLVSLINELSDGDSKISSESNMNEEDSNSLAEKPIIDTGQIESSNSFDSNKKSTEESENSNESKKDDSNGIQKDNISIEETDENARMEQFDETDVKMKKLNVKPVGEMIESESLKRSRESDEEQEPDFKKPKNIEDEQVSKAVEEPLMLIKGQGAGVDNEGVNPIIGEEIEEDILYVYGCGTGSDCQTGNQEKNSETKKSESCKEPCSISSANQVDAVNSDSVDGSSKDVPASPVKSPYKLGTIIDIKTDNKFYNTVRSPTKKSRWDVETIIAKDTPETSKCHVETESTGKVKDLVNKWEQITNEEIKSKNEEITETDSTPKKPMFFFGPGSLLAKPNVSPVVCGATMGFGVKVPQINLQEKLESHAEPNNSSHDQDVIPSNTKGDIGYRISDEKPSTLETNEKTPIESKLEEKADDVVTELQLEDSTLVKKPVEESKPSESEDLSSKTELTSEENATTSNTELVKDDEVISQLETDIIRENDEVGEVENANIPTVTASLVEYEEIKPHSTKQAQTENFTPSQNVQLKNDDELKTDNILEPVPIVEENCIRKSAYTLGVESNSMKIEDTKDTEEQIRDLESKNVEDKIVNVCKKEEELKEEMAAQSLVSKTAADENETNASQSAESNTNVENLDKDTKTSCVESVCSINSEIKHEASPDEPKGDNNEPLVKTILENQSSKSETSLVVEDSKIFDSEKSVKSVEKDEVVIEVQSPVEEKSIKSVEKDEVVIEVQSPVEDNVENRKTSCKSSESKNPIQIEADPKTDILDESKLADNINPSTSQFSTNNVFSDANKPTEELAVTEEAISEENEVPALEISSLLDEKLSSDKPEINDSEKVASPQELTVIETKSTEFLTSSLQEEFSVDTEKSSERIHSPKLNELRPSSTEILDSTQSPEVVVTEDDNVSVKLLSKESSSEPDAVNEPLKVCVESASGSNSTLPTNEKIDVCVESASSSHKEMSPIASDDPSTREKFNVCAELSSDTLKEMSPVGPDESSSLQKLNVCEESAFKSHMEPSATEADNSLKVDVGKLGVCPEPSSVSIKESLQIESDSSSTTEEKEKVCNKPSPGSHIELSSFKSDEKVDVGAESHSSSEDLPHTVDFAKNAIERVDESISLVVSKPSVSEDQLNVSASPKSPNMEVITPLPDSELPILTPESTTKDTEEVPIIEIEKTKVAAGVKKDSLECSEDNTSPKEEIVVVKKDKKIVHKVTPVEKEVGVTQKVGDDNVPLDMKGVAEKHQETPEEVSGKNDDSGEKTVVLKNKVGTSVIEQKEKVKEVQAKVIIQRLKITSEAEVTKESDEMTVKEKKPNLKEAEVSVKGPVTRRRPKKQIVLEERDAGPIKSEKQNIEQIKDEKIPVQNNKGGKSRKPIVAPKSTEEEPRIVTRRTTRSTRSEEVAEVKLPDKKQNVTPLLKSAAQEEDKTELTEVILPDKKQKVAPSLKATVEEKDKTELTEVKLVDKKQKVATSLKASAEEKDKTELTEVKLPDKKQKVAPLLKSGVEEKDKTEVTEVKLPNKKQKAAQTLEEKPKIVAPPVKTAVEEKGKTGPSTEKSPESPEEKKEEVNKEVVEVTVQPRRGRSRAAAKTEKENCESDVSKKIKLSSDTLEEVSVPKRTRQSRSKAKEAVENEEEKKETAIGDTKVDTAASSPMSIESTGDVKLSHDTPEEASVPKRTRQTRSKAKETAENEEEQKETTIGGTKVETAVSSPMLVESTGDVKQFNDTPEEASVPKRTRQTRRKAKETVESEEEKKETAIGDTKVDTAASSPMSSESTGDLKLSNDTPEEASVPKRTRQTRSKAKETAENEEEQKETTIGHTKIETAVSPPMLVESTGDVKQFNDTPEEASVPKRTRQTRSKAKETAENEEEQKETIIGDTKVETAVSSPMLVESTGDVKQSNDTPEEASVPKRTRQTRRKAKETVEKEEEKKETAIGDTKVDTAASSPMSIESTGDALDSAVLEASNDSSCDNVDSQEHDPLAVSEEDAKENKEENTAMSLATFSLDFTESPTPAPAVSRRNLRKRGRESPTNAEEVDATAEKRIKMRGKRSVDVQLRKSIEEQKKQELASSDDESKSEEQKSEKQEVESLVKRRGKKKEKHWRAAPLKTAETAARSSEGEEASQSDAQPHKRYRNPASKNKRILSNLGINPEQVEIGDLAPIGVRQSRRIAQLKIREEAERRKIEDDMAREGMVHIKKKKSKKSEDKDYKVEKKKHRSDDDEAVDDSSDSKHKKKKKKKRKLFDELDPWRSSSDSSSEEDEEEIVEEETDEELQYVSDHEFSPESDMEGDGEWQPLKRARTARKESDVEEEVDDCPCQKCGKSDHPEWILLCDRCDNGWHCSCLRPPLLVIPEGDWFCPPCQHAMLLQKLEETLTEYDKTLRKKEIEDRRKQRLAYVGISLNSVLPTKDTENIRKKRPRPVKPNNEEEQEEDAGDDEDDEDDDEVGDEGSGSEESESDSGSGTATESDSDEPIYQLRQRRQAHSYRFNDYDDLINSAIQDEMEAVKGAGNQGRGKDIATIVNAEKEEERKKELETPVVESENQEVKEEEPEPLPPLVPPETKEEKVVYSDDEPVIAVKKKLIGRKKHRKLNSLDISSADDDEDSDEDFKGTSSESDDEFDDDLGSEDSDDLDTGRRRRHNDPVRRSTRARVSRYDADFIDDGDSEDEDDAPRRKKKRSIWDESESEESDRSWGRRKRRQTNRQKKVTTTKKKKSKKKKKSNDDSDADVYRKKKPKIKFGLDADDDGPVRRTRGKKINYVDALGSDSDEDRVKRPPPRIESEEEYVANEEDELDEDDKISDEDVDSGDESVPKPPTVPVQPYADARFTQPVPPTKDIFGRNHEEEIEDDVNPIDEINKNLENMDANEMEKMMDSEEYANKQLQLVALQIEKEKRRKEREAKKLESLPQIPQIPPPQPLQIPQLPLQSQNTPKKRGRKPKNQFQFTGPIQEPIVGNVDTFINVHSENNDELSEPPGVSLPMFGDLGGGNGMEDPSKKRRGRNKKSLEEAVANLGRQQESGGPFMGVANKGHLGDVPGSNIEIAAPPQPFSQSQPTPSVITRMLQSKPGQPGYPVGTIRPKQFASMADRDDEVPTSLPASSGPPLTHHSMSPGPPGHHPGPPGQYIQSGALRPQLSSPYRQIPPNMNHFPRGAPPPPHQIRNPVPQTMPSHIYHSHRPMDPSPSGGGPISIADHNSPGRVVSPASSSPSSNKNETPPPPYSRPPVTRFPIINSPSGAPRHMHMVAPHLQPPRPNMSPYHSNMPPSYHYGQFGQPPMGSTEDAMPPTVYQNSPYSEQFPNEGQVNPSENSNNSKSFDEESGGEFGGLVSYFSSQREDDLES